MNEKGKVDRLMVKSVVKAFRILEVFDAEHPAMSVKQLAERCDMDRSAAQRFVHTLTQLGYLQRNEETQLIEPSVRTLDIAAHYLHAHPLVDKVRPYLLNLSKETEGSVSLTILDGPDVVYLSRLLSRNMLDTDITIGSRLPAFCTAPGLAMLSQLEEGEARAILEGTQRKAYTPNTVHEVPAIMERLDRFKRQGYALSVEEYFLSDISIAVPVLDRHSRPRAAVSISMSRVRSMPEELEQNLSDLLIATARQLSRL
ncbi:helix-turn-helix domain-containing protein [Billgrantia pellis]|uniref:Helix-turn-helix domain-containing protein n=1 Tax=Billgrantia pellis TaxID=2606936 RepID=A0A7V7G462_9GAMM|nr:IclR family transcriptional regulator C-terminal domain-containing protein [Halomonas pellis]KAA0013000.1 helix-turn-helix domain-containing protein [Halomonas pellis]